VLGLHGLGRVMSPTPDRYADWVIQQVAFWEATIKQDLDSWVAPEGQPAPALVQGRVAGHQLGASSVLEDFARYDLDATIELMCELGPVAAAREAMDHGGRQMRSVARRVSQADRVARTATRERAQRLVRMGY